MPGLGCQAVCLVFLSFFSAVPHVGGGAPYIVDNTGRGLFQVCSWALRGCLLKPSSPYPGVTDESRGRLRNPPLLIGCLNISNIRESLSYLDCLATWVVTPTDKARRVGCRG